MTIQPITAGAARRLTPQDIRAAAASIDVPVPVLKAVMAVESAKSGFDAKHRPTILFEPHVFYRNLRGDELMRAIMLGVAYSRWGQRPYPKTSDGNYARLELARKVNNEAAFRSVSMGLGQILGENFKAAGYQSAGAMFVAAADSEANQLMQMVNFIKASRLEQALRNRNWASFASHYNGAGYRANRYDARLADAYRRELRAA